MVRRGAAALTAAALLAAIPAAAAPVRDAHLAAMAGRLFPSLRGRTLAGAVRQRRIADCAAAAPCLVEAAIWRDDEREALARDAGAAADDVRREVDGLNEVLRVYGVGKLPRYPLIDGSDEAFGSAGFAAKVADAVMLATMQRNDPAVTGDPSLSLALALLDANGKDAAIAFEPLGQRYNAGAIAKARGMDWSRFRYSAIIALGVGPEDIATPLSARGKANVRLAADAFDQGLAPFIIVSGSAVHPRDTPHVEAVEMRRALIDRFGIPADAIIVEPYARHTTTNLRNATRQLIVLGAPLDRDTLVVSNTAHIDAIASPAFTARNQRELGYQPGRIGSRPAPNAITFRPDAASRRVDPIDPLDP
ncbi:YdcF family protein [Sphingomonas mollis]|uniref:YdcF family protein n=1 Tax=Sphingomonas mollis TaxID=2795726 RepID=A0ABS0XK21_9SPHN|nr:YdcF family protein [Sphingomonas sp. BT553]MBJ6120381.1 YdcF family protein [Sphingomonas sp. BT553]